MHPLLCILYMSSTTYLIAGQSLSQAMNLLLVELALLAVVRLDGGQLNFLALQIGRVFSELQSHSIETSTVSVKSSHFND